MSCCIKEIGVDSTNGQEVLAVFEPGVGAQYYELPSFTTFGGNVADLTFGLGRSFDFTIDDAAGIPSTLNSAITDAWTVATSNALLDHSFAYTNTSTRPQWVEATVSCSVDLRLSPGNRWQLRLFDHTGDVLEYQPGGPSDYSDTSQSGGAGNTLDQHNLLKISHPVQVAAGASVTSSQQLSVVPLLYSSSAANRVIINHFRISFRAWSVH